MLRTTKKFLVIIISVLVVGASCAIDIPAGRSDGDESNSAGQNNILIESPVGTSRVAVIGGVNTYYVRPDGGTAEQCTGLVDSAYPGSGLNQPCAWSHPFYALPPGGKARIAGGDTLMVASGSYMMGYGAPDPKGFCDPDGAFDCYMPPIPGGPDESHPTRILGSGWDTGCGSPPELWGTQRALMILNLAGSSHIEIACLEITDHSACVEDHGHAYGGTAFTCERDDYPFGEWADSGIYAQDSADVTLRDLDIHGLAVAGVRAGRLGDWIVENVRIAGNGWVGWEGDIEGQDANTGTMTFRNWLVEWNGCAETYPGGQPTACWAQSAGGYGDGVGTGATGGDWIITDSQFLHNTSDGLDLLYHELGGSITLDRVRAEGNAGNQVKVTGETSMTNSVLVGNCNFFDDQPFTYDVDACRALGNTFEVAFTGGERVDILNSTFYGHGDGLVGAGPREGYACDGTETIAGDNNIFLGDDEVLSPGDITFIFYQQGCGGLVLESDYSIAYNIKNNDTEYVNPLFPSTHNLLEDPQLLGPLSGNECGMELTEGSPAIDAGNDTSCPDNDIRGDSRPIDGDGDQVAECDMGAYEWRETRVPGFISLLFLPMTMLSN